MCNRRARDPENVNKLAAKVMAPVEERDPVLLEVGVEIVISDPDEIEVAKALGVEPVRRERSLEGAAINHFFVTALFG